MSEYVVTFLRPNNVADTLYFQDEATAAVVAEGLNESGYNVVGIRSIETRIAQTNFIGLCLTCDNNVQTAKDVFCADCLVPYVPPVQTEYNVADFVIAPLTCETRTKLSPLAESDSAFAEFYNDLPYVTRLTCANDVCDKEAGILDPYCTLHQVFIHQDLSAPFAVSCGYPCCD